MTIYTAQVKTQTYKFLYLSNASNGKVRLTSYSVFRNLQVSRGGNFSAMSIEAVPTKKMHTFA